MEIQVDITLTLTEDFVLRSFGYTPSVNEIVHRAILDIDGSHPFVVNYQAKNVVISDLDCEER